MLDAFFSNGILAAATLLGFVILMVFFLDWLARWWDKPPAAAVLLVFLAPFTYADTAVPADIAILKAMPTRGARADADATSTGPVTPAEITPEPPEIIAPKATSSFAYGTWTWSMNLAKPGKNRHVLFGARAAAKVDAGLADIRLFGMADASATQDGGAVEGSVNILDPATFTDIEGTIGAYRPINSWLAVAAVYGIAVPVEGGKVKIIERFPQHYGAGLRVGSFSGAWLYAVAGRYEAAGDGFQIMFSGLYPVKGRVSAVTSGAALGPGKFIRTGIAVYLDGTAK